MPREEWPWSNLDLLIRDVDTNWDRLWLVMKDLSDSMSRKSAFGSEELRKDAVIDSAIYAMERIRKYQIGRNSAISYFGVILLRRQRQISRKQTRRICEAYSGSETTEDCIPMSKYRTKPVIGSAALRAKVGEELDRMTEIARRAAASDIRQAESAPLVIHTIQSLRRVLVGIKKSGNLRNNP